MLQAIYESDGKVGKIAFGMEDLSQLQKVITRYITFQIDKEFNYEKRRYQRGNWILIGNGNNPWHNRFIFRPY